MTIVHDGKSPIDLLRAGCAARVGFGQSDLRAECSGTPVHLTVTHSERDTVENVTQNQRDDEDDNALLSRLTVIEEQPLEARAAAFRRSTRALRETLEGGDSPDHGEFDSTPPWANVDWRGRAPRQQNSFRPAPLRSTASLSCGHHVQCPTRSRMSPARITT